MAKKAAAKKVTPSKRRHAGAKQAKPQSLKVEATQMGYYNHQRRREGDIFTLADENDFSRRWMRWVDARKPEHTTGAKEALAKEHRKLTETAREDAKAAKEAGEGVL